VNLLVDTHIWIWRLLEPERLSEAANRLLADPENSVYLSPVSVWETLVLARKGRIKLRPNPQAWLRQALQESQTIMTPLTHEIAMRSEALEGFGASDPADRFLVATALVEDLTIVTVDRAMLAFDAVETVS
jgi:PIN domain nuclease of toxin-antitoxin system